MSAPAITVLMTVYNGGEYLHDAIKSVLTQTFTDFEFLIVNDCSRDHSVQTITAFDDQRIRLINNETNLGQTRSLNKGLLFARGRYIARMDADDLAFPTWLDKSYAFLQSQPSVAAASCKAVVINDDNQVQKTLNTPDSYEEMVVRSLFATPLNHVGSLYKTDVITSFGGYEEVFKIAADYELWSKLIRAKIRLAAVGETLVAIRVHERSISINERGRSDVGEISEIMGRNFKSLVGFCVAREQIFLLWKMNYAPETLSAQEFRAVLALLENAYEQIKPEFGISASVLKSFREEQLKVFYAKRAFSEIEKGNLDQLRALTRDYRRSEGLD
jgi:glycosyltransferase involved in cell wall biosynthesis